MVCFIFFSFFKILFPTRAECLTLSSDEEDSNANNDSEGLDAPCDEEHEDMSEHDNAGEHHLTSAVQGL